MDSGADRKASTHFFIHRLQQVCPDGGSDLVLQVDAAGEGDATGLHAGVGVHTLKVDILGPVLIAVDSTALKLQTHQTVSSSGSLPTN